MLKINCKGKRTVGKANKRINVKKKKGLKILKGEQGEKKKKRKMPQNCKAKRRGRGL